MPTDFKPTHTYHGTTTKRIGQECMLYDDPKESVYVTVKFSDGMHLSPLRVNVKPIERKPEFEPTHIYVGNRKAKYNQPCVICVVEGMSNVSVQFEDGEVYKNVGTNLLEKIKPEPERVKLGTPVASGKVPISSADRNFKPEHYHSGGIDPWQFIEANLNPQQAIGFHLGNTLKYVARHEKKNGLEDLKKAQDSLKEAIRLYEKCGEQRSE